MKHLSRLKPTEESDTSLSENTLLPILSLMMILIPLLIGKAAFFDLVSLEAELPNMRPASEVPNAQRHVLAKLQVTSDSQILELIDEESGIVMESLNYPVTKRGGNLLKQRLATLRLKYTKLDTAVVTVTQNAPYKRLISSLEAFGNRDKTKAFKVVVVPSRGL